MLLLLLHFLIVFLFQAAAKVQELCKGLRLQNTRDYMNYNPQAISSALALLGGLSPGPLDYKFHKPLCFKIQIYEGELVYFIVINILAELRNKWEWEFKSPGE